MLKQGLQPGVMNPRCPLLGGGLEKAGGFASGIYKGSFSQPF